MYKRIIHHGLHKYIIPVIFVLLASKKDGFTNSYKNSGKIVIDEFSDCKVLPVSWITSHQCPYISSFEKIENSYSFVT